MILEKKTKLDKFIAQHKRCFYCNASISLKTYKKNYATRDHFIPLSKGGANDIGNIVLCCKKCNTEKSSQMPLGFLTQKIKKRNAYIESKKSL